jgi:hypothetical protein
VTVERIGKQSFPAWVTWRCDGDHPHRGRSGRVENRRPAVAHVIETADGFELVLLNALLPSFEDGIGESGNARFPLDLTVAAWGPWMAPRCPAHGELAVLDPVDVRDLILRARTQRRTLTTAARSTPTGAQHTR